MFIMRRRGIICKILQSFFWFRESGAELCVDTYRDGRHYETYAGRRENRELAVVQRLKDHNNTPNNVVFICAGTGEEATKYAAQHLLDNWEAYQRKYKDGVFGVCLALPHKRRKSQEIDTENCGTLQELPDSNADRFVFRRWEPRQYESEFPNNLDFEQLEQHHRHFVPFLKRIAENSHVTDRASYVVKIMNDGNAMHFDLLEGAPNNDKDAPVSLSYDAFCILIFIDFGKWTCEAKLEEYLREHFATRIREYIPQALSSLCRSWFELYRAAAEAFFESKELVPYFESNVSLWWNEDITFSDNHRTYRAQIEENIELGGKDALELGCGFGRLRALFATAKRSVHVDASSDLLKVAMENGSPKATFVQADINFLPRDLMEDLFDSIILLQICMHLRDPFDLLTNAKSMLKSEGEIWVDFTCAKGLTNDWYQESFFTRIYKETFIIERIESLGMKIVQKITNNDRLDHYWLLLRLVNPE
jgi:ubiquinone/menaquinone biosynthesis C-methylase UbiE